MKTITSLVISGFCLFNLALAQDTPSFLPNPKLTPGATLDVTEKDLCKNGYESRDRTIPVSVKGQVVDRYGINASASGYNIDHLIPVGLAGSNSLTNLWPQPLSGEWSYQKKNRLEAKLQKMVCSGAVDLKTAQNEIANDWVSAYKKYLGESQVQ
jgi:hypothetical protein